MADFIDFPQKLRSTRADGKLVNLAAVDGEEALVKEIADLDRLTTDIQAPDSDAEWADATNPTLQAALTTVARSTTVTLAVARGIADASWVVADSTDVAETWAIVRVPAALPADARLVLTGNAQTGNAVFNDAINQLRHLGESADGTFAYYVTPTPIGEAVVSLKMQVSGDLAHKGATVFSGVFDGTYGPDAELPLDNVRQDLSAIHERIADLRAPATPATWGANTGAARLAFIPGSDDTPDLSGVAFQVSTLPGQNVIRDTGYVLVSLPDNATLAQYRLLFGSLPGVTGDHWTKITPSAGAAASTDYYAATPIGGGLGGEQIVLQASGDAAHVGNSTFAGILTGTIGAGVTIPQTTRKTGRTRIQLTGGVQPTVGTGAFARVNFGSSSERTLRPWATIGLANRVTLEPGLYLCVVDAPFLAATAGTTEYLGEGRNNARLSAMFLMNGNNVWSRQITNPYIRVSGDAIEDHFKSDSYELLVEVPARTAVDLQARIRGQSVQGAVQFHDLHILPLN